MSKRLGAVSAASATLLVFLVTSCGSRTGLFAPEDLTVAGPEGSSDDPPATPVGCTPGQFELEPAATRLMFVLDRSTSMADPLDARGGGSRWQVLRDGLAKTIVPFDQQIAMGAKFYPEEHADFDAADPPHACQTDNGVGLAPKRGNAANILKVFDTTPPLGATPTSEALRIAAGHLVQNRAVARAIVLATDGAPNCNSGLNASTCTCAAPGLCGQYSELCLDDTRTIATVKHIADTQGIPVYVIGLGNTERPEFLKVLDAMAVAGGHPRPTSPRHYNVQTPAELGDALATIRDSASSCTFLTPSSPTDPDAITLEIDGSPLTRDESHQDGWDWADRTYGVITLFGTTCDDARGGPNPVKATVRCP